MIFSGELQSVLTAETATFHADVYLLYTVLCSWPYVAADVLYTWLPSVFGCSNSHLTEP